MIKKIEYNNVIFGIIINSQDKFNLGHNFITNPNENLQVNILNQGKASIIPNHLHNFIERKIYGTQEVLYVEKGVMKVKFLTTDGNLIGEEVLNAGDLVVLLRGGHGFEFLEDTKIIYVKQGPYLNKEIDKIEFEK